LSTEFAYYQTSVVREQNEIPTMQIKILQPTIFNILLAGILFFVLEGCQAFQPKAPGELAMLDQDFVDIWDTYNHCMANSDIQEMTADLHILSSAPKPISLDDSPIPVPRFIKKLSATRSSRLAVDPRAMAVSCSIHLAEVAQHSADWNTALHTFQSIIQNYPEPRYAFYVEKANSAIEEFSSIRPASLSLQDALVR
jgi:hypothetical protein